MPRIKNQVEKEEQLIEEPKHERDNEYKDEQGVEPQEEEQDDDNDDDDEQLAEEDSEIAPARKRGRKRKITTVVEDEDNNTTKIRKKVKSEDDEGQAANENEEDNDDDDDEEEEEADEEDDDDGETEGDGKKKRGRKKKPKVQLYGDDVFDDEGNPLIIKNDEVVIPQEDPKGKEKIDELGYLQGDRKFRMKTFKLLGKGDRLYMISTEPARLVGFRDSYLLFKTHRTLFKKVADNDEKIDLIQRGIIPNSYKGRAVNLVTARSIFREFGSRMIENGKKVIDDFWEQRAIDNGDIPGELADPDQLYKTKLSNVLGDSGIVSTGHATPLTATPIVNYQGDPTWMYQIAKQTSEYNKKLYELRTNNMYKGYKDTYTNLTLYPQSTQPTQIKYLKFNNNNGKLVYDIVMTNKNIRKPITGLAKVPQAILNEIDDPEIKQAIIDQQEYEISAREI